MQNEPHGFAPRDVSLTLNGSPQQLVGANQYRSHLQFQAPSGSAVTYSWTNSSCAAGLTGCFTLAAGQTYLSGPTVATSAVYVNGTAGQLLVATEC